MQILPPPGPQRARQFGALAVTVVIVAMLGWRQMGSVPAATPAPASNPVVPAASATSPISKVLPEAVRLGDLEPVPEAPESRRNLFRFGVRPPPSPPPAPPQPPPAPPMILAPPVDPGPPPIPLRAVGRSVVPAPAGIGKDPVTGAPIQLIENRTIVTLKDPTTGRVVDAVEGQIIDGKYKVLKIGLQSVEMSYLDGSGFRRIQIGGGE